MFVEYLGIALYFVVATILGLILVGVSFVLAPRHPDAEKLSSYECGFDPFEDARGRFDVQFYLVAILFIIFDLEVAFLFPWAVGLAHIGTMGWATMMVFLTLLTAGFVYEWRQGALDWS
jgi:NADH:ubiquinone oxidoreductase subunit 3 (subunit A)